MWKLRNIIVEDGLERHSLDLSHRCFPVAGVYPERCYFAVDCMKDSVIVPVQSSYNSK